MFQKLAVAQRAGVRLFLMEGGGLGKKERGERGGERGGWTDYVTEYAECSQGPKSIGHISQLIWALQRALITPRL